MSNTAISRLIAHTARRGTGFAFIEGDIQTPAEKSPAYSVRLLDQSRVLKHADFIRRPWQQNQVAWQQSRIDGGVLFGVPVFVRLRRS